MKPRRLRRRKEPSRKAKLEKQRAAKRYRTLLKRVFGVAGGALIVSINAGAFPTFPILPSLASLSTTLGVLLIDKAASGSLEDFFER